MRHDWKVRGARARGRGARRKSKAILMSSKLKIAKGARSSSPFATIDAAVAAIGRGEMVIVVDDEDRENEGDLTIAAERVTPDIINFMATEGRGLICMP